MIVLDLFFSLGESGGVGGKDAGTRYYIILILKKYKYIWVGRKCILRVNEMHQRSERLSQQEYKTLRTDILKVDPPHERPLQRALSSYSYLGEDGHRGNNGCETPARGRPALIGLTNEGASCHPEVFERH